MLSARNLGRMLSLLCVAVVCTCYSFNTSETTNLPNGSYPTSENTTILEAAIMPGESFAQFLVRDAEWSIVRPQCAVHVRDEYVFGPGEALRRQCYNARDQDV